MVILLLDRLLHMASPSAGTMQWTKPSLNQLQNKCLHLITGAFETTPTIMMEIKVSITLVESFVECKLDMEVLRLKTKQ